MNKRKLAALAALWSLAAVLAPLVAQAQTGANGTKANTLTGTPIIYYEADSTRRTVGSGQGLPVQLVNPDWSKTGIWTNAINDTIMPFPIGAIHTVAFTTIAQNAESTSVIPTEGFRVITAALRAWPAAPVDTTGTMTFAIQVRGHLTQSADSSSTFPIMDWSTISSPSGTGTPSDSIGGVSGAPLWPNAPNVTERLVKIHAAFAGRAVKALFGSNGVAFTIPARGGAFAFPYISIRVRTIASGSTTAALAPRVVLHLYGGR